MRNEIRYRFNKYFDNEAPKQLKRLFDDLSEEDGIMLQSCFEDFAKSIDQSARIRELEETVAFFASVIKSGEPWTEQCEQALNKATNGSVIREG